MKNSLVREPDAGNPHVRFDERYVETEHGMRLLRHKRGNPGTELCRSLNSLRDVSTLQLPFSFGGLLMIVEIAEARAMFEAAHRYLAGQCTIQELNGCASRCAAASHLLGGHPAIKQIAEDWMAAIDRRWNEFGHVTHPLCENEFRNWLRGQLLP